MSEPMSSGEIEDVLSSIRRLVSEDLRPASRVASAKTVAPEPSGKLLLTPAFRVVTSEPFVNDAQNAKDLRAPATDSVAEPVIMESPFSENFIEQEDVLVEIDVWPLNVEDEDAAPEGGVSMAEDWLPEAAPTIVDDLPDEEPEAAVSQPQIDAAAKLNRVMSEIGAAVAESDDEWEPEAGDASVSGMSWQAPEWVEEAELVGEGDSEEAARALADAAEAAAVTEIIERAAAAKAEAVKEAEAKAATEAEARTKTEAQGAGAGPEADIFAEDEGYFDETVLRDLVRDLIREELSGALGERITRNVRKLVRAEINRALTARDFD
jgi:hypothetical protein